MSTIITLPQRIIMLVAVSGVYWAFIVTAIFNSTPTALGYGDCTPTAPRAFHRIGRSPKFIRFLWHRPNERCDENVKSYTVVTYKANDNRKSYTITVKAPRHQTPVLIKNLFGSGKYRTYVYAKLDDGTLTPNSHKVNFVVK